jgi:hypothetical protein
MRQVIPLEPQRLLKLLHSFPVLNRGDITQKQALIKLTILNRIPNPQTQRGVSHLREGDKVEGHEFDVVFEESGDFVFVDGDELAEDVFVDGSEGEFEVGHQCSQTVVLEVIVEGVLFGHQVGDCLQEELLQVAVPEKVVALYVDFHLVRLDLFLLSLILVNYLLSFTHLGCFAVLLYLGVAFGSSEKGRINLWLGEIRFLLSGLLLVDHAF